MKKRALCALLAVLLCVSLLPVSALAAEDTVAINETNFPDPNFRSWLQAKYGDSAVISQVTEIDVANQSISNLKGVEYFTALTSLNCELNNLTTLDMSGNTGLTYLRCRVNELKTLDVSKNTALTYLNCYDNQLTSLDVSSNTSLEKLYCDENPLKTLDVSNNTELTDLSCSYNQLTTLDISRNTKLSALYCYNNQLTSLDISRNPHLLEAYIKGEKGVYSNYTRYLISGRGLHVDSDIKITCLSVTAQPKSQTVAAGKTATLSVEASGQDLTYQWYVQKKGESTWTELTGETKQELTVTAAKELDGSSFRCEITGAKRDGKETLTSEAATLTIVSKPKVTAQPKAASVKAGKKVTFKVKASGGSLTYQWYRLKPGAKKWEKIKKATKASYSFKAAKKWNGYKYKCLVKNKAGKVYTKAVKLTVK
jgi:Leucine-rich repeat (LRR) protein